MRIAIVTPVQADSNRGNGVTARRWQRLLAELGHDVAIFDAGAVPEATDVLIALHARKSAAAVAAFATDHPGKPIVLAMTGTDLYGDLPDDEAAQRSVALADRIVVLQPVGIERLPAAARRKTEVILQSVPAPAAPPEPDLRCFGVCVLAHLREVKDPFLAARAAMLLPGESKVHVTLAGAAPDDRWRTRAQQEEQRNPRFTWVGDLPGPAAAELLRRSRLLVVSSTLEGGANVVSESIVQGVPVLATRIDGNVGLLGADYAGYFPVGDAAALAQLLRRAETDRSFHGRLTEAVVRLQVQFDPARERAAWHTLLRGLA